KTFRVAPRAARPGPDAIKQERERDKDLEVRLSAKAGTHVVSVTFPKRTWYMENVGVSRLPARSSSYALAVSSERDPGKIGMALERSESAGPSVGLTPGSVRGRQRLFSCRPATPAAEDQCARWILGNRVRRAFRGPAERAVVVLLMTFYRQGRTGG